MICTSCQHENLKQATFCSNCGVKLSTEKSDDHNVHIRNMMIFFFTMVTYIVLLNCTGFLTDYISTLISDSIFALIVLSFFFSNFNSNKQLLKFNKINGKLLLLIIIITPLFALSVHYLADFLNENIFDASSEIYYEQFRESPYPFLLCVTSIGLCPALFEEIAFRGILFDESLKLVRLKPAIILTSIMFTFLHFSLISAIWILPIGIILGYFRARYNTLVYGMLAHFLYNTSIVVIQLVS